MDYYFFDKFILLIISDLTTNTIFVNLLSYLNKNIVRKKKTMLVYKTLRNQEFRFEFSFSHTKVGCWFEMMQ